MGKNSRNVFIVPMVIGTGLVVHKRQLPDSLLDQFRVGTMEEDRVEVAEGRIWKNGWFETPGNLKKRRENSIQRGEMRDFSYSLQNFGFYHFFGSKTLFYSKSS